MKRLSPEENLLLDRKPYFVHSEWVEKEANMRKIMQRRFLAITTAHLIYFHDKPTDFTTLGLRRRMIPLVDMIRVSIDVSSEMKFRVQMPDRDFIFKTRTIAQCNDWVTILKANKETIDSEVKLKAGIKIIVQPNVSGFVLKTRTVSNPEEKIFVNVFWSDDIDTFISTSNVDRDSQTSSVTDTTSVFSVVLPGYVMESCNSHAAVKDEVCRRLLSHIAGRYGVDIDPENYSTPKIRRGFIE